VTDLSPLKGLPLKRLAIHFTKVSDMSPLQGMKLEYLDCYRAPVRDISSLKGMPLEVLDLRWTKVSDLSPLQQCKNLKRIGVNSSPVTPAEVAALKQALPNCTINWDAPASKQ
jgi:internalin A